jgi:hypothetical protein
VFPPREAPLEEAVAEHLAARAAPWAGLLGPLLVDDRRLPAVLDLLARAGPPSVRAPERRPVPVSVVVSGGAGAVGPVVRQLGRRTDAPGVVLHGVEVALRDLDDLAGNARRVVAAVRAADELPAHTVVHVEVPLTHVPDPTASSDWLAALDEVAAADLALKLRTGGLDSAALPSAEALAAAVDAALDRELPFKCTAGLHHAVRHRAADTGFEHHGFLNLLLATAAAWDGAGPAEVARLLEERDAAALVAAATAGTSDGGGGPLATARRWFTSFGCCAVADPLADLVDLGLLPRMP